LRFSRPVSITPAADLVAGSDDKLSNSEFDQSIFGGLIQVLDLLRRVAGWPHGVRDEGRTAIAQTIGGLPHFVGNLASRVDAPTPCVSEEFLTTGSGSNPSLWDPTQNMVHIAIRMKPGDPHKRW
jgi:hypothetical protein